MSAHDPHSHAAPKRDFIARGSSTPTPAGTTAFVVARAIEPALQWAILGRGLGTPLLHSLGLRTLPAGLPGHTGVAVIDALGLSPYRLVLFGMAVGAAVKQNIWVTALSGEPMPVKAALAVGTFNAVFNSINSYAFLVGATSASTESDFPQPALMIGSGLYVVGILAELVSEVQRKRFKSDPKNKGKAYTGGLWQYARHINYGGYTLWRVGYAIAGGGYVLGALVGAFFLTDFATRAVPALDEYCEKRYGEAWGKFKAQTRWKLIPFVY
jgi:protein-S-isoprenylcysteine O-methyltransferase Ste14